VGTAPAPSLRILIAEDSPVNQQVALGLLERLGYEADVVWNGREAVDALEREPYDVVLMDVNMPELDGLEATRRICERWQPGARPRIVAMTASAMAEDREACFAAGMDDFLPKPIRLEALGEALGRARPGGGPEPGPGGGTAELDDAAFDNLEQFGSESFLGELIDTFVADTTTLLAALRRSLDEEDAQAVRRAAHTLRSYGETFGAPDFSQLCRQLEERGTSGALAGAAALVDGIEVEFGRLQEALAARRSGAPT
jgi:CheY-like chemotaxis protein